MGVVCFVVWIFLQDIRLVFQAETVVKLGLTCACWVEQVGILFLDGATCFVAFVPIWRDGIESLEVYGLGSELLVLGRSIIVRLEHVRPWLISDVLNASALRHASTILILLVKRIHGQDCLIPGF